jgi:cytochrome b561
MIAVPLAGWIFVSLAPDSRPPDFRGLESVPELPFAHDDGAALAWHEAHELMGFAMIGLFLLHIAGALRSQMRHGDFLDRMVTRSSPYGALRLLAALAASVWVLGLALDMLGVRFWAD